MQGFVEAGDEQRVRGGDAFADALAGTSVAGTLDLYEAAAVSAAPDVTEIRGRDDLRRLLAGLAAGNTMSGTRRSTVVVGDLALASTSWTAKWPGETARRPRDTA